MMVIVEDVVNLTDLLITELSEDGVENPFGVVLGGGLRELEQCVRPAWQLVC